jgi:uncharacterized protein (TIGR02271 family)
MNPSAVVRVTDALGVQGTIDVTAWPLDGRRAAVPVTLEGGRQVWVPVQMLTREAEGRYTIPIALADLERRAGPEPREPPLVLPVLAEALDVQTRRVETGRVRIHKTVQTREVLVDEPLVREEVVIERVPVNRVVEGPIPVRYEGDTMILSLLEEVLVVEMRLLLKEELRITTRWTERHAPERVTLRHEDVTVERVDMKHNEPHTKDRRKAMAKTVIGLFDDRREAQHIVQALMDDGFRREDIRTLTGQEGASAGTLGAYGVPEAEAQQYADAVRQGGALVLVDTADERADRAVAIMERPLGTDREARPAAEAAPGTAADTARERERAGTREVETGDVKVPVVEEELQVGTRQVRSGGVRLYTRVTERPVEETVRLRDETVRVERRPVDRPATEADVAAAKERTIEVTETDEEAVARKQARVVEEVVVRKDVQEQAETVRDTVRRTEVEVEEIGAGHARETRGFDTYDADFRGHYTTSLASRGHPYERWSPGYRYGYELAGDSRYAGRDWTAIEADARRDWEARHQGTWDEFKDTIRYAWDKVRGRR